MKPERKTMKTRSRKARADRFGAMAYILNNIMRNRWRTFLTITGIAVPIAFFILFAALGEGLDQYITSESTELNKEQYRNMSRIINSWTDILILILAILIVTSIFNTLVMSTAERKHEFGVLKALGISHDQILYLIILEAFILSLIALIVGTIIGIWCSIFFDYMFQIEAGGGAFFAPAKITLDSIFTVAFLTLFIGTVTAVYPALKLSKLDTVEILRCE